MDVSHCNGLFLDPTDRSPHSIIVITSGVRLPLTWIWFLFYSSPRPFSYVEDEAVNRALQSQRTYGNGIQREWWFMLVGIWKIFALSNSVRADGR